MALPAALWCQAPSSDAKQAALGAQMSAELAKSATLISDPAVRAYVSEVTAKLGGRNLLLTLQVTDSDNGRTHEPIWLPGGYMFISAELIRNARSEAEFAGMMAHALAHEIGDDSIRIARATPSGIPFIIAGSEGALAPVGYAAHLRPFELEADASAVKMLSAAGYDPIALYDYLSRVEPRDIERMDTLTRTIAELTPPSGPVVVDSSDFRRIQECLTKTARVRPTLYSPQ
jgi:predicted Zn-dependent protease